MTDLPILYKKVWLSAGRKRLFVASLFFAFFFSVASTHAGPLAPFSLQVGSTIYHDANIFRRSEAAGQEIVGDTVHMIMLGAKVDKTISKQRIVANIELERHMYAGQDLDYTSKRAESMWHWAAGDRLTGLVSYNYWQRATSLSDYTPQAGSSRNLERFKDFMVSAEFRVINGWRITSTHTRGSGRNSVERRKVNDSNYTGYGLGFGYNTRRGSQWRINYRKTDTEYPNRAIDEAIREDIELTGTWVISQKSRLQTRLGYTKRNYSGNDNRDFNGITGFIRYSWWPTYKLGFVAEYTYDLTEQQEDYSDFAQGPRIRLTANWNPTTKVGLNMSWTHQKMNYSARDGGGLIDDVGRKDTNRGMSFAITYTPIDPLLVRLFYDRSSRDSTLSPFVVSDYSTNVLGISLDYQF